MTITLALNTAAHAFGVEAHVAFIEANMQAETAFTQAVNGKQLERMEAETRYWDYKNKYWKLATKAKRCQYILARSTSLIKLKATRL